MQTTRANSWRPGMLRVNTARFMNSARQHLETIVGRFHSASGERRMELIETLELGGKRQLMLVTCDGNQYLIGSGPGSVQAIAEMRSGAFREPVPEPDHRCQS